MLESAIEDYLNRQVERVGGEVRKMQWIGRRGAPDRLVLFPKIEQHFLVELKREGDVPEAHQAREHKRLRSAGFKVFIIDSKKQVDAFIAKHSKPLVNTCRDRA
jgi:hypothetical protein